nr:hypothetical protein CCACVL1_09462 [Ipomoea batatas]
MCDGGAGCGGVDHVAKAEGARLWNVHVDDMDGGGTTINTAPGFSSRHIRNTANTTVAKAPKLPTYPWLGPPALYIGDAFSVFFCHWEKAVQGLVCEQDPEIAETFHAKMHSLGLCRWGSQAEQVYYLSDIKERNWQVVVKTKPCDFYDLLDYVVRDEPCQENENFDFTGSKLEDNNNVIKY